jgi:hypothetical protein
MQIDGEPWIQSAATVTLTAAGQVTMLRKPAAAPSA